MLPTKITGITYQFKFTIATLVTNMQEYNEMRTSFVKAGFTADNSEYIYVDNIVKNSFDGYSGLNLFLQSAKGEYIIIAHQDVIIDFDDKDLLLYRIDELNKLDNNWAILSNAGGIENDLFRRIAVHVVYKDGFEQIVSRMPKKVCSVDEHFIVVKNSANLSLSSDLSGFHLYGTDICLIAEALGYSSYAIDFKITHKSYGNPSLEYYVILKKLIKKYSWFMRSRTIVTTITDFRISVSGINSFFFNTKLVKKINRKITKLKFKMKSEF